jgi:hypothetical protein
LSNRQMRRSPTDDVEQDAELSQVWHGLSLRRPVSVDAHSEAR